MIKTDGPWFRDEQGRTLILHGVNLSGSSKVPVVPDGATYRREGFFEHRGVSFVGRPFPIEEADEHFSRLRSWGFTFLRFLITWEAIEHAGPGIYDEAYLDYVAEVVRRAGEYGFDLFIDPHQDVWSRFSGGDGAPGWTLEAVGLDMTGFAETGAAIVHATHGDPFPRMIWPTNGSKLAAATMFTLFFGGNDFAPDTRIEGEPVQDYLQRHYIDAVRQVVLRLKGMPNVVGYDTLNEPGSGYIGHQNLLAPRGPLQIGDSPGPFQSMLLGEGIPQEVAVYALRPTGAKAIGTRLLNQERRRAWLQGAGCVWRQNGVWDMDAGGVPHLLKPDHFSTVRGREVDFTRDYLLPFAGRFAEAVHQADPGARIFIETEPGHFPGGLGGDDSRKVVHAPHWYDMVTCYFKDYMPFLGVDMIKARPVFGPRRVQRSFNRQLGHVKNPAGQPGQVPTLIGEFGIAFDLKGKRAYRTGDFGPQVRAIDRSFRAMEANLLSYTLWNYTPDNTNERGDLWNDEDFSIFSRDQQKDPGDINSGGRALEAVVRPYAMKTAGEPLRMAFSFRRRAFEFEFRHDPAVGAPTEIFVPALQYPAGCHVEVTDGEFELDRDGQRLLYRHGTDRDVHSIHITPR